MTNVYDYRRRVTLSSTHFQAILAQTTDELWHINCNTTMEIMLFVIVLNYWIIAMQ